MTVMVRTKRGEGIQGKVRTAGKNPKGARSGIPALQQRNKAARAARAEGGTSTSRMKSRRTTNPNAAKLALGKGRTAAKLNVGGAGKPAPSGAKVPTSRGEGTKGLNVGGSPRPGGTVSISGTRELRSPLGVSRRLR